MTLALVLKCFTTQRVALSYRKLKIHPSLWRQDLRFRGRFDAMNHFLPVQFSIFNVEIILRGSISLFRSGLVHSGSETWDDCGRAFPNELRVSSFPWHVPILRLDSIISPVRLYWVKNVCVFMCNLSSALWAERPVSFTSHCGNMGVERTLSKSTTTKKLKRRKRRRGKKS